LIKAIETKYNGYRFRSRLEARWAVFFDEVGIEYEYELEGFEVVSHDGEVWKYLPDFFLPKFRTWVEVKGDLDTVEWEMIPWLIDFQGSLPGLHNSLGSTAGLLWLGSIPGPKAAALTPCFTMFQHESCGHINGAYFEGKELHVVRGGSSRFFDAACKPESYEKIRNHLIQNVDGKHLNKISDNFTFNAFQTARQARFEHGQTIKR